MENQFALIEIKNSTKNLLVKRQHKEIEKDYKELKQSSRAITVPLLCLGVRRFSNVVKCSKWKINQLFLNFLKMVMEL